MLSTKEVFLIAALLCFMTFLVVFSVNGNGVRGIRQLLLASVLGLVGNVLYAFGRELPPLIAYEAANAVYAAASAAAFVGYRHLFNRPPHVAAITVSVVVLAALIALFHYAFDSFMGRTAVASLYQAGIAAGIGLTVLAGARERGTRQYPKLFVLAMCALIAGGHLFRILRQLLAADVPGSLLEPTGWNVAVLAGGAFALPALALGGLLLAHRRIVSMVEEMANRDFLTGAASRKALYEEGAREISRARRTGRPLCALLIDLDNFKSINDTNGHDAGDRALIYFAQQVQSALRTIDCLGRMGGDEFAVLIPETDLAGAVAVAKRLKNAIDAGTPPEGTPGVAFSIGVSCLRDGDTVETLFKRADVALYQAKRQGRNQAVVEHPDDGGPQREAG